MKKILVISSRVPYPLTAGYKMRVYNFGKILNKHYKVDLITADAEGIGDKYMPELEGVFNKVLIFNLGKITCLKNLFIGVFLSRPLQVSLYYSKELQKWLNAHHKEYDLILCVHIRTAEYAKSINTNKVIDLIDAMSLHYQRALPHSNFFWKIVYKNEIKRVLPYELNCMRTFNKAFVVSNVDRKYLENNFAKTFSTTPSYSLSTITMGINEKVFSKDPNVLKEKNWITFLGKMNYAPNVDAVIYFAKEIFPLIKKQNKEMKFIIVGTSPNKKVRALQDIEGVEVTGFVEDPFIYLKKSKVIVVPIRFGAGVQNKALETMGLGKPAVTTSIVSSAIGAENNFNILIANDTKEFVEKVLLLLSNENLGKKIGYNARKFVEKNYTWKVVEKKLIGEINDLF